MTEAGLSVRAREEGAASAPVLGGSKATMLQALLLHAPAQILPLYRSENSGPSGRSAGVREVTAGLSLQPGAKVSFDSYFNCFYENVWFDHTVVADIVLEAGVSGDAKLSVFRSGHTHVRQLVAQAISAGGFRTHRLRIPRASRSRMGRLHFEIEATGPGEVRLDSAGWATLKPALWEPRLAIAMCTFNKPEAVVGNLAAVLESIGEEPWLHELIVVDQGTRKVSEQPRLEQRRLGHSGYRKLRIVEQGNFGGAGGFTRGIVEAMAAPEVTHVTLMDDDVEIEPRVFQRLHGFLSFVRKDVIVGGQMFDLFSPLIMRTFAEAADYNNLRYFHVGVHSIDFAQPFSTGVLEGRVHPTYNGWWLCTYPRALIEEHDLPLPVFVRCDDSEYSTRMTAKGAVLVSLPGFMVWHEPFHAKIVAWMMYYETRNFLLLSLLRAGPHSRHTILLLLARIWTFAARGLYDHSEALLRALETFLEGPGWLKEDPRERHLALTKDLKALAPETLPEGQRPGFVLDPWGYKPLHAGRRARFARSLYHHLFRTPETPDKTEPVQTLPMHALIWPMLTGRKVVGIYNPFTNQSFVLRLNRSLARQHLLRGLLLVRRWWALRNKLARDYKRAARQASLQQEWTRYLGIEGDQPAASDRRQPARSGQD